MAACYNKVAAISFYLMRKGPVVRQCEITYISKLSTYSICHNLQTVTFSQLLLNGHYGIVVLCSLRWGNGAVFIYTILLSMRGTDTHIYKCEGVLVSHFRFLIFWNSQKSAAFNGGSGQGSNNTLHWQETEWLITFKQAFILILLCI